MVWENTNIRAEWPKCQDLQEPPEEVLILHTTILPSSHHSPFICQEKETQGKKISARMCHISNKKMMLNSIRKILGKDKLSKFLSESLNYKLTCTYMSAVSPKICQRPITVLMWWHNHIIITFLPLKLRVRFFKGTPVLTENQWDLDFYIPWTILESWIVGPSPIFCHPHMASHFKRFPTLIVLADISWGCDVSSAHEKESCSDTEFCLLYVRAR